MEIGYNGFASNLNFIICNRDYLKKKVNQFEWTFNNHEFNTNKVLKIISNVLKVLEIQLQN